MIQLLAGSLMFLVLGVLIKVTEARAVERNRGTDSGPSQGAVCAHAAAHLVPVHSVLTGELLAAICTDCEQQVSVDLYSDSAMVGGA